MLKIIVGSLYAIVVGLLVIYALHLSLLIVLYLIHKSENVSPVPEMDNAHLPDVLVQIPLRNERFVVNNVLQSITQLNWPRAKLRIQILDDSDDDTFDAAISLVLQLQKSGYPVSMIHRKENSGYKAGALSVGMAYSHCPYMALFDADFMPNADFLQQTIPYLLSRPELAMVQTRWCFQNSDYSYVTKCEAMALEGHFVVDHIARNRSNLLMNFNGTAGVWRRSAIEQCGGWQSETLAEDLDLSYRAQLTGWKLLYLPEVTTPSQLPRASSDFREQQRRWAKGATQTLRKLWQPIIRSHNISTGQKLMAILHLSGYTTQFLFVNLIVLSLPMAVYYPSAPGYLSVLGPISVIPIIYYTLSQTALHKDGLLRTRFYPLLALLGIASAMEITLAQLDGLLHWGGDFHRTPKFSSQVDENNIDDRIYQKSHTTRLSNIPLIIYIAIMLYYAFSSRITHYILPGMMYLTAQTLMLITSYLEHKKMREK